MKNDSARDKAMDKLVAAELRSNLKPAGPDCLDAEILAAYVERTLTARERANCDAHLASCANCQEHVAALVRLGETDEPEEVSINTTVPARAAGISWFRWAWAGPALAAMLVIGVYLGGPFRHNLQTIPGPENRIQTPVPAKSAEPPAAAGKDKGNVASPAAAKPQPREKEETRTKVFDDRRQPAERSMATEGPQSTPATVGGLAGRLVRKEAPAAPQNATTTPAPMPPPRPQPQASERKMPAARGAIATPSVRADLAKKDEGGQGAGVGETSAPGVAGGGASGTTANTPSAKSSVDNLAVTGRDSHALPPSPAPKAANEQYPPAKSAMQAEAKAKKEARSNDQEQDELQEKTRQTTESASVTAAPQQLAGMPAAAIPAWRVGPHGLIQKLNEKGKWKKQKSGVTADLFSSASPSPAVCWVVGKAGTILRTTNGGMTWSQLPSPTSEDIVQITATSGDAAAVTTRDGQRFTTEDAGNTWSAARQ